MSVERKIRELLEKKQLSEKVLDEQVAGDTTNPKQGSSEDAPVEGIFIALERTFAIF